jgi:hypothetical protein
VIGHLVHLADPGQDQHLVEDGQEALPERLVGQVVAVHLTAVAMKVCGDGNHEPHVVTPIAPQA